MTTLMMQKYVVALHTSAWIETDVAGINQIYDRSHSIRVRGLKRLIAGYAIHLLLSHSIRVRGLKQLN